jgi:hypothetical protein
LKINRIKSTFWQLGLSSAFCVVEQHLSVDILLWELNVHVSLTGRTCRVVSTFSKSGILCYTVCFVVVPHFVFTNIAITCFLQNLWYFSLGGKFWDFCQFAVLEVEWIFCIPCCCLNSWIFNLDAFATNYLVYGVPYLVVIMGSQLT